MKAIFLSFVLLFVLGVVTPIAAQKTTSLNLGISNEKKVTNDKLKIKFVAVTEDSRCPAGVSCIWAGNAKVQIKITNRKGKSQTFELNTNLAPQTVKFEGYEIKIAELTPTPQKDKPTAPKSYALNLIVTKAK